MILQQQESKPVLVTLIILTIVSISCHNYYKATTARPVGPSEASASIDSLQKRDRYFILRNSNMAWHIKDPIISADRKSLSCTLEGVATEHQLHFSYGRRGVMQYKKTSELDKQVLNEVHLYISADPEAKPGPFTLALDKVEKIEVLEKDAKRTTSSYVIGAIGYTLGAVVVAGIIIAATKSSCPFISAWDGQEFALQGEVYGGAIYPQLARHDYIPLKMAPSKDNSLQVKISNELKERQYTDIAQLIVVTHDKNKKVAADENGNIYSYSEPQLPVVATLNNRTDALPPLSKANDHNVLYMDDPSNAEAVNELSLTFNKPATTMKAKLILTLKNSYWLDLLYGDVAKGFGTSYASYISQQKAKPAADLWKWVKEQKIPLEVATNYNGEWKNVTSITTIGPLANREIIVPLNVMADGDKLQVKLSAGFMFWEIDYAAIDFSTDEDLKVEILSPQKAIDQNSKNVTDLLAREDDVFLGQPNIGDVSTISYKASKPLSPTQIRTYILHVKGYYEHIRDFKNKPDLVFLSQFTKPGGFPVYGMNLYHKISNETLNDWAQKN